MKHLLASLNQLILLLKFILMIMFKSFQFVLIREKALANQTLNWVVVCGGNALRNVAMDQAK